MNFDILNSAISLYNNIKGKIDIKIHWSFILSFIILFIVFQILLYEKVPFIVHLDKECGYFIYVLIAMASFLISMPINSKEQKHLYKKLKQSIKENIKKHSFEETEIIEKFINNSYKSLNIENYYEVYLISLWNNGFIEEPLYTGYDYFVSLTQPALEVLKEYSR